MGARGRLPATHQCAKDRAMHELSEQCAWDIVRHCARVAGESDKPRDFIWTQGQLQLVEPSQASAADVILRYDESGQWARVGDFPDAVADFLDLYLPVCAASTVRAVAVGHLGQSLDGFAATSSGDSHFVNDARNIVHLHRMRALCDAVVVGGATVRNDDPRLTVRLASGDNPLRVVIDPRGELDGTEQVFTDQAADTLWVTLDDVSCGTDKQNRILRAGSCTQQLRLAADVKGNPDLPALLDALHARNCHAVFVEGGGITVTRFMNAGLLDRIQVAIAPLFIGQGRAGIRVAAQPRLQDCLRPAHRLYRMGTDVLFDCDLSVSGHQ
ncbi:MAG: diaminohydroxyphosphoribosylaminopyrimidine deaminase [Gammaproteobacteria bacterium]|jgi:diaminohydroxyphosphoribosylaminopyrimidine deaminase/5-amino-6-(5-phosphoribosylamino)uracil reductase